MNYNPGLDPMQVYRQANSDQLIYGDGRPYVGPAEAVQGAIKHIYEPLTAAGLQLIIEKAIKAAPYDQMQALYDNNPWFRSEVDKEAAKLLKASIHYRVKRAQDRKRLKRKRLHQK